MVDQVFDFKEDIDVVIIVRPVYLKKSFDENLNELKENREKCMRKGKEKRGQR